MPFNAETARIAAVKSHAANSARNMPKPADALSLNIEALSLTPAVSDADKFRESAKLRARDHLSKLQSKIDDLLDERKMDVKAMRDLADAVLKLETVEQRLSGRALPGTLRPTNKPAKTKYPDYEPQFSVIHEPETSPVKPVEIPTQIRRNTDTTCSGVAGDGDGI